MPPKKSKKKQPAMKAVEDALLLDIFGYLDKIQDCLDLASIHPASCLDGIAKADEALRQSQGDSGIQCTILMKRAQLLFIAVENMYDTRGLSEWHRNALESCILDCEQVLSGLSSTDPGTKDIYRAAQELNSKARAMAKTRMGKNGSDAQSRNPKSTFQVAGVETRRPQRFDPERTVFKNISKINPHLLQDVVDCYRKAKIVCKYCFFRNRHQEKVGPNRYCRQCKRTSPSVLVIPAMLLANGNKHKPFQYCHNHDHMSCFEKSAIGDSWFAHSIEELVIWTVQRHYGCSFSQYIKCHHEDITIPPSSAVSSVLRSGELDDFDSSLSGSNTGTDDDSGYEFYPDEVYIDCVASIPQHLLDDVIECYDKVKEYCKWCFYKRCKMGVVSFDSTSGRMVCSLCMNEWQSVLVIPASDYCWNFGDFEYLPIAPWPRGKWNRDPFEYCAKEDHFRCFKVYIDTEFWYSHTVEEQVIWTVEREHDCTFSDYVRKLKKRLPPELVPKSLPPPHPPASVTRNFASSQLGPMSNAIQIATTSASNPTTKTPYDPSPHAPSVPTFSSILASPPRSSPPRSSRPNFRVSTDSFLGGPSANAENPSIGAWNTLVSTGFPPLSTVSSSNRAGNSPTRSVNPTSFAVNALGPTTGSVNPRINSAVKTSMNRSINALGPTTGSVNPQINSVNPANFTVNSSMSHSGLGPTTGSVNRPITSVNPVINHPISAMNPPISLARAVNPPTSAVNPPIGAMHSAMNHWITVGGPSISAGYQPAAEGRTAAGRPVAGGPSISAGYQPAAEGRTAAGRSVAGGPSIGAGYQPAVAGIPSTSAGYPPVGASVPSVASAEASPETAKEDEPQQVFKLSEISFKVLAEIPRHLLESIARCFCQKVEVCRKCFYGDRSLSSWLQGENMCSLSLHKWMNPIFVIPGCDLCNNEPCFKKGEYVPIPPLPPLATIKKCSSANHHKCFLKSLESNEWFAHSIEELVVWVVESEKECSFDEYIIHELQIQISEPTWDPPNPRASQRISEPPVMAALNVAVANASALPQTHSATAVAPLMGRTPDRGNLFDPEKTIFNSISDIPSELLGEVAQCFQQRMLICRICYFESHCKELSSKKTTRNTCERGHSWRHVTVIPRCSLCISSSTFISILPLPKHMRHCNSPFQVCKKTDHQTCYFMSKNTNPWFPHTVEELVIWTVEREKGCSFEQVYESFLPKEALKPQPVSSGHSLAENGSSTAQMSTGRDTQVSIAPNLHHPSIDTLDLTKPEDREPIKNFYPGGKSGGEFAMNLHSSSIGFEEAVFLTSKGDTKQSNIARPPPPLAHSQANPDSLYNNFANYNMVPNLPPSPPDAAQPVDLMGLPLSGSMGGSETSPFSVMPMEGPQGGLTADDALEYFPALLGNRTEAVQMDFPREEDEMLLLGSGGRVHESQNEGGAPANSSSMNFLDPLSFSTTDNLLTSSSVMSSAHPQNHIFQTREEPQGSGMVVPSEEPISNPTNPFIPVPTVPANRNPSAENWPEVAHSQGFMSKLPTSMAVANSLQPAQSPVEDHALLRMPTSQPLVLGNASLLDDLTNHESSVPVASVNEGVPSLAPASESTATLVSVSKSEGMFTSVSRSVAYEDGEASEAYQCLLCYTSFESAEQLVDHCKGAKHSLTMLLDSGNMFIWKHLPPPSDWVPEEFGMCANPGQCHGGLACQRPHYADELSEWKLRYQHRNSRKQTTVNALSLQLPTFSEQEVGLLLNVCPEKSQYQAVKLSLSNSVPVTTSCEDSSFSWKIDLEGEDWQSLHGITCQTLTPSVFRIMRIEGDTFFTIQPKCRSWEAHSVNHAILLGKITVTIKATPASVGSYSCQVHLNLGFQQFLSFRLELTVRGLMESASPPETGLRLLAQPVPELMAMSVHQDKQQVQLQMEPDEPQVELKVREMEDGNEATEQENLEREQEDLERREETGEREKQMNGIEEQWKAEKQLEQTNELQREEQAGELGFPRLHFKDVPTEEEASLLPLPVERHQPHIGWQLSSSSSDELGIPNIEGEDLTLIHVPIEDLGFSLTGESGALLSDPLNIDDCS